MSTRPPESPPPGPSAGVQAARLVRTAALFYAGLLGLAWLWRSAWLGEPLAFTDAAAAAAGPDPARDAALGAAAAAAVVAASWVLTRATGWGARLARALADLVGRPSPSQIAFLALASGIAEEAFFRGALQPRVGLVVASLVFGLAHLVPRREFLPWSGFTLVVGFGLGALFDYTGNLLAPIVAHVLVNGINLHLLTHWADDPDGRDG